jgi:hypothetical protein
MKRKVETGNLGVLDRFAAHIVNHPLVQRIPMAEKVL